MPAVGDALKFVLAGVLEDEPGARNEILHGGGHEDLGGTGERTHPGADVHGESLHIVSREFVYQIPDQFPLPDGDLVSTTEGGNRPNGRLILSTSRENMPNAYRKLKPRWRVSYRSTPNDMIGSKPVSDFTPALAGAGYEHL